MEELQKLYDVLVRQGYYTKSFEEFQNKWQDENYRSKVFGVVSRDKLYTKDEDSFNQKYQSTKAPSTWYGVPKEAQVGGFAPDEMSNLQESLKPEVKKKEPSVTTALPSADGSSVPPAELLKPENIPAKIPTPQDLPQGQGRPFEFDLSKPKPIAKAMPKTAIQKAEDILTGIVAEPVKGVLQFADNVINSEKRALKDSGFFDEEIPDSNSAISDALQRKLSQAQPKGTSPFDITGNLKNIVQKIINSNLSQENKNKTIKALEVVSNQTRGVISDLERYQKENLPEDNLVVDVTKGIAGMAPDLLIAALMKNPTAAESRLAQLTEKATEKASPFIKKVAPKAAKVLEEAVRSPFTKIMAVKGGVKAMAEAKEDENPYWEAVRGSIEGAGEGMYMHLLGKAAGKTATPIARKISKSGLNSAIATTISTPLANAGVFTTAKALRTAIMEQRLISGREAAMEVGTGIGFSLLHLGSQYKNQKELNHYYDNVLNDNVANSLGRVLNETKSNLDIAYNPELTPEEVTKLEEARDELKKAILREPDMEKKQLLGNEAIKIQNQLDAHNTIADIVQNKDFIVDILSRQDNLTPDQREFFANKVLAIADAYDMSDFAVKKRDLNARIDEAQKKLDESGEVFSNLKNPSDRISAKLEVDKRRQELEDLNAQLTDLIINKTNEDAIQKQKSDEALLRAGEERLGLRKVGEGDTKLEATPEQEQIVNDERKKFQERLDNPEDQEELDDAKEYFDNPVAYYEKKAEFWKQVAEEDVDNKFGDKDTYEQVKQILEAHKAMEAPKVEETNVESFETSNGSVYTVLSDGRIQRFKTATGEQNEPQDLTVFVKLEGQDEQNFLEAIQKSEDVGKKVYVVDEDGNVIRTNEQAKGKKIFLAITDDAGTKVLHYREATTEPTKGYNTFDQRSFSENGQKMTERHMGNKVTKINTKEPKATEAKPEGIEEPTEFNKKMQEEITKRGLDRLFPAEIDETTPEGKRLAKEKAEQDQKVKELEEELKSTETKPEGIEEPKTKEERKSLSDKLRSLKSNKNYTYESVLGIPVAIWDGSIELIAKSIDAGVTVSQAIKRGINYIEKNHRGKWDKKQFNDKVIQHLITNGIDINKEELEFRKEKENAEIIDGFYSPLEQGLLNSKTEKTTGKEWVKKLEGLTEGEELKYTGMYDFLSENAENLLTKQELLDYMKNNRIQIKEIVKEEGKKVEMSNDEQSELSSLIKQYDLLGFESMAEAKRAILESDNWVKDWDVEDERFIELGNKYRDSFKSYQEERAKYKNYQLPGEKSNYKEVLITLPRKFTYPKENFTIKPRSEYVNDESNYTVTEEKNYFIVTGKRGERNTIEKGYSVKTKEDAIREFINDNLDYAEDVFDFYDENGKYFNTQFAKTAEEAKQIYIENNKKAVDGFKSSHYDEPNILAHIRMNTRIDAEGNKVLFIEEFQSDWGQKGKKEGFNYKPSLNDIEILEDKRSYYNDEKKAYEHKVKIKVKGFDEVDTGYYYPSLETINDFKERVSKSYSDVVGRISQAPFVTKTSDWTKLAWKTALKKAVNQGVEKIAWTTGEQQNERYKLSNVVDKIIVNKYKDGDYSVKGVKGKQSTFYQDGITEDKLSDYIGKELAQKAINEVKEKEQKTYEGEDLEIGGKGMKGFYGSTSEGKIGIIGEVIKSLTGQNPKIIKIGDVITLRKNFEIRENRRGMFNIYDLEKGPLPVFKDIPTRQEAERMIEAPAKNESTQYSIDITPEIKESVKEGISMFKGLSEAKSLADRVRSVKIGKGKAFDAILGIPVAIWDGSVELVAKSIEAGKSISEAIKSGVKYIKDNHKGKFNESEYADKIKDTLTPGYKDVMDKVQEYADFSTRNKEYWAKQVEQAKKSGNKEREKEAKAELAKYTEGNLEEAMKILEDSETYKNATDIEKEELIRDVESRFELKQKKAPSPEELFGDVADVNKVMEELNFLFEDANKSKDYLDQKYNEAKAALEKNPTSEKLRENVRKAKAEVEEYKTKNIDNAIAKLKESESYKKATPDQQARMEKYLTDKFLKSQTSKILPTKLFGGAKDIKKVTITEKKRWADQLKAFVRGIKNQAEATKVMMTEVKSAISELSKKGNITAKQAETIINKMASLKVSNEKGINKFVDYVSKVFADAEYGSKISEANKTRSSISKLAKVKGKDPNLVILAKNFMKIKPSMVEDIDAYNDMASKIKESLRGTKIGNKETPLQIAEMVKISEANKYIDEQLEAQRQALYEEKLAEMSELFDTDLTGATFEQLLELARSNEPIDKEKETIIRDAIKKVFDMNSTIIKSIIEKGEDPFTGEKIELDKEDIDLIKKFMGMDLNKLDIKDGIEAIDKLANFLQNGSIGNMESVIRSYQAKENIDSLNKKGLVAKPLKFYGSGLLGRTLGEQMATLPILLENMFKGVKRSSEFEKMSGIAELKNAKTFVQALATNMGNDYTKEFYERKANDKDFTDASNVAERGLIAALKRTISGTPEQQQAEFNRKKGLVEQSIDELKAGTEKEQKLGKIYEEVYDKVLKDSKNIDDVISKSDKNNVEAVDWWINKWSEVYDKLANVSESVYNKVLDKDLFYTPDRFSRLFEKEDVKTEAELDESLFHHNTGSVYKKETGVLQKSEKPSELPKNENGEAKRYLDLSFDKNNVNSMYDALMDINTAGVIRQIETFFKSPGIKKIIPTAEDRAILYNNSNNGRVQDFIRAARNKEIVYSDEASKAIRKLNTWSAIGTSSALGSVGGIFKQTIPVAANTLINAGNIDLGYFLSDKANFLGRTGYGISIRGLESQAQISSINKLVDLASKSTGAKALEYIEKANRLWLDTFLKNPDVFIAKASWMSYYEKALKEQGIDPSTIDYNTHEVNKDAADYAQKMVDRQQNISDTDLQGKLLGSKNVKQRFIVSTLMPFASFRVNQFMRAKSDIATITSKDPLVTKEDRKTAALSLAGYATEMVVFKLIATKISAWIGDFTNMLLGKKESDEDRKKRVDNLVRGQLTGTITDVLSPIPTHIVDLGYAKGADYVLDKLQSIEGIEDKDKYKLMTSMKANELQSLGTIGIGIDKFRNYLEAKQLAETGEFVDEYGRKKYISQKDKEAMKSIAKISFLSNFGLLPAEANTISRNAIKFVKRDASSKEGGKSEEDIQMDEQYREQRQLNKEEKQQVREEKASILQQLRDEEYDSEKVDIMDRKIKEYLMTDEERTKYNEDTKSERFLEKQKLNELLGEYDSKSDMKKYDPELYEERFGEGSDWYNEHIKEEEVDKQVEELMTQAEEDKYGYSEPEKVKKPKKEKRRVIERSSFSFGRKTFGNQ